MSNSQATQADAELILKLYDLRRETVMREARNFIFGFMPQTIDDVMAIISDFSAKENAYLRQVVGYWEHGGLAGAARRAERRSRQR